MGKRTWSQPMCRTCWNREEPDRDPYRVVGDDCQTCAFCGRPTAEGIYVRANPDDVLYPREEAE